MKRTTFFKSLLLAAGLSMGANAWADEVTLTPTADTELNWTSDENKVTSFGTATSLNCGIWQEMWTNATPGLKSSNARIALLKFDVSNYKGKLTSATLKLTGTNPSTNSNTRSIYLGYFTSTSWDETTTASGSGMNTRSATDLNIQPFNISQSLAKGETKVVSFSNEALLTYLNNDEDGIVSFIVYGVGQGCFINSKEAESGKPQLVLTYSSETLYTATFTETSNLEPTVTIYSDENRANVVTNGTLTDGTTYYYTASLAGYADSKGSFTVDGAAPSISITMTKLARYTFTVNAVDGNSNVIKALFSDEDSYAGKAYRLYFSKYLTDDANVVTYSKDDNAFAASYTSSSESATQTVSYTAYTGQAWFFEGESFSALGTKNASDNYSGGNSGRGLGDATLDVMTMPLAGTYNISYAVCSNNTNNAHTYSFYKNSSENVVETQNCQWSVNYVKTTGTKSVSNISFASGDVLKFYGGSTNIILDYVLVELASASPVTATLGANGYTTFASAYDLDLSNLNGFKAYTATLSGAELSFTECTSKVVAGTGLLLKGTAAAEVEIPVATADAVAVAGNALTGVTADTNLKSDADGNYIFVMKKTAAASDELTFLPLTTANEVTVPAGKAYVAVPASAFTGGARSLKVSFGNEATGINAVEAAAQKEGAYNLNGQRVMQPTKGLYIVNGKKVIINK